MALYLTYERNWPFSTCTKPPAQDEALMFCCPSLGAQMSLGREVVSPHVASPPPCSVPTSPRPDMPLPGLTGTRSASGGDRLPVPSVPSFLSPNTFTSASCPSAQYSQLSLADCSLFSEKGVLKVTQPRWSETWPGSLDPSLLLS